MYGKTKLSKRQIKEDKFTAFMLTAKDQFFRYWQYLVIGLVAVVLIVIGVVYYFNSQQAKEREAADKFSRAMMDYRSGNSQLAILGFNQIMQDYSGNRVAEDAAFLLGNINYETRNYPEAIRYYQMYLSKFLDNKLNRAATQAGIASSLENQGNYREAAEKFIAACDEYPNGPLNGDYYFSAMRDYLEVGEVDKARAHLDIIKDKFKGTELAKRAVRLFSEKS